MGHSIRAHDIKELASVNDVIHDRWFDVDDIAFDKEGKCLTVRFRRPSIHTTAQKGEEIDWVLEIHRVESFELTETEHVGRYDFNVLKYDAARQHLLVTTGVPLLFRLIVQKVDVLVREED